MSVPSAAGDQPARPGTQGAAPTGPAADGGSRAGWRGRSGPWPTSAPSLPLLLVPVGLVVGTALSVVDLVLRPENEPHTSWLGALGAGIVAGVVTAVLARRVFGPPWWLAAVVGGGFGMIVLLGAFGPSVLVNLVSAYVVVTAGTVAVLLTRPVRGLAVLVIEYAVACGVAVSGAAAVSGVLGGAELGVGVAAAAVVATLAATLVLAAVIRSRLTEHRETVGDLVFVAVFILAVLVAVGSAAVILAHGGWSWAQTPVGGTVLIGLSLALLGVGAVVRSWTPSGWWVAAPAALGAGAVVIAAGAGGLRSLGAAVLGVTIGFVAGVALTVAVAALIGVLVRAHRARPENIWRGADEPGRLAPLT